MTGLYQLTRLPKLKSFCYLCLVLVNLLAIQPSAFAAWKIDADLRTQESMQEHTSDEPRRLMHDVLAKEFAKGNVVRLVNPENAPNPVKLRASRYHIAANLIAFSLAANAPIHLSLSMQLVKDSSREVIMQCDRALYLDEKAVNEGLKLKNSEFENSLYGKALTTLTRAAAKQFEMRVLQLNISNAEMDQKLNETKRQGKLKKGNAMRCPFYISLSRNSITR